MSNVPGEYSIIKLGKFVVNGFFKLKWVVVINKLKTFACMLHWTQQCLSPLRL